MIELVHLDIPVSEEFRVHDFNLKIETGTYAVLMGPTGCGKSTVLEAVCGLKPVAGGEVWVHGKNVTRRAPRDRGVGYVPQDLALFRHMSVADHLRMGPRLRGWRKARVEARVGGLMRDLKIEHLRHRRPSGLSGGERQRVALGRALAAEPDLLLLDEPLSALDTGTHVEMMQLLSKLRDSHRVTVLHVTHHPGEAEFLGEVVFRMRDGVLVEG